MTKILVAADMEGISGVTHPDHVTPGHAEWARFRRVMTAEVNAAVRGAFEAGADEVTVADGHSNATNILIEELDPRARLNTGSPSPLAMVQGVQDGSDGAFFIGYYARAGTQNAVLDHTWSSRCVLNLWLNGEYAGETSLNAAVCGHYGAPVLLVTGDQAVCAEAQAVLDGVETVAVKRAVGRTSAECLPAEISQERILQAAARAVRRLIDGRAPQPFRPASPVTLAVELATSEMADRAALIPGSCRVGGRRIEIDAPDMPAAYMAFRAVVGLAGAS